MKINREARQKAKKIFRACLTENGLNEEKLRESIQLLAEEKSRNYLGVLSRLKKLVELEVKERTAAVESATPLSDRGEGMIREIGQRFGKVLASSYQVKPELIGGLRVQYGSNVWDGSIRERLNLLEQSLN